MYRKIAVPVDLFHADQITRALDVAADLAGHYGASLHFIGVTAETPTAVAHNPAEFAQKLEAFAAEQGKRHGVAVSGTARTSTDPAVDVDKVLLRAIADCGADLVVMASHVPGISDYLWGSHGGHIAAHAEISVFVVR
ncbi:MAG: universal stress protein [Pararhodobacter sp.]|nr:universal stress protein [Pararhodobacter sp.]